MKAQEILPNRKIVDITPNAPRVLLVEPDPLQALLLRGYLETDGVCVHQATDRRTALRYCQEDLFDLAVIDDRGSPALSDTLYRAQLLPCLLLAGRSHSPAWPNLTLLKPYTRHQFRAALRQLLS